MPVITENPKNLEKVCPNCETRMEYEDFLRMRYDYTCHQCRKVRISKWVLREKKNQVSKKS